MKSPVSGDQKFSDRLIVIAFMIAFAGWFVFAAFDAKRFGWSPPLPVWLQAIGVLLIVIANWGWFTVLRVNSFASVKIKVQADRKQTVISTGPYALVRHPMYSGAVLYFAAMALLLGSWWGLVLSPVFFVLFSVRAGFEERALIEGLPGYADYLARVRYRLVPGVW